MTAQLADGWLLVPYDGPELAQVRIGTGRREPDEWKPAYLDWHDGRRVAKVRPPVSSGQPTPVQVWTRLNGVVATAGHVTI